MEWREAQRWRFFRYGKTSGAATDQVHSVTDYNCSHRITWDSESGAATITLQCGPGISSDVVLANVEELCEDETISEAKPRKLILRFAQGPISHKTMPVITAWIRTMPSIEHVDMSEFPITGKFISHVVRLIDERHALPRLQTVTTRKTFDLVRVAMKRRHWKRLRLLFIARCKSDNDALTCGWSSLPTEIFHIIVAFYYK